jgi:phytoene dehydrogenase-like protein
VSAPDVAVLGAGPAGLACAWELASRGARVVVLEASPNVGGLAATTQRDGFRFDLAGHAS